ncbi:MAG: type I restriction-modification system endonuclease [Candidatus Riflebacteria bacterium]|nr:type I restriction-modification system endonuclease [Candidatus Riflebacteria bacterium]
MRVSSPNFSFLETFDQSLFSQAIHAEKYCLSEPVFALTKLRLFGELLARNIAARFNLSFDDRTTQNEILRELKYQNIIDARLSMLFHNIKTAGNRAVHEGVGSLSDALTCLRYTHLLAIYFYRVFQDRTFKAAPFEAPIPSEKIEEKLQQQLDEIARQNQELKQQIIDAEKLSEDEKARRLAVEQEKQALWQQLQQAEKESLPPESPETTEISKYQALLSDLKTESGKKSESDFRQNIEAAQSESDKIYLSEAETRQLIDQQLRDAGWEANSAEIRYSAGVRPEKNRNKAIAEWPTKSGPADYVLFVGLQPLAVVEAKKKAKDVSSSIDQAKRYSRDFNFSQEIVQPRPVLADNDKEPVTDNPHKIPFVFATNGRPFLRQLETLSGIWFCDVRRPQNLRKPLETWYTPEGLRKRFNTNFDQAEQCLKELDFNFDFQLRKYQKKAIQKVEEAIIAGKDTALLAMATGTGKTKTSIALLYRLLKSQRFNRILFLVDRSALGIQAADAFKDTEIKGTRKFADIFGIKELKEQSAESDTSVQLATVQSMVQRILYATDEAQRPKVDEFDCIVVDECHRGYLLDREMSDTELLFRDGLDYISKYRRILDYFDAFKIGLTATPALHTSDIFGKPVFTYSYREAVIDGFLIDHDPPVRLITQQTKNGIAWKKDEQVPYFNVAKGEIEYANTPDQLDFDVATFNSQVITPEFNRVVAEWLARRLDPTLDEKTLIFCVNDRHAETLTQMVKEELSKKYDFITDDMVMKITGAADKPMQLFRRYKNEKNPKIAVTVDLLTTGIDVPEICNLVFVRRVNSRILYEQMLGRATRLCPALEKEAFKIYDAVNIYENLQDHTQMRPVVVNPKISFAELEREIVTLNLTEARQLAREQFVAKLRRKRLSDASRKRIETKTGKTLVSLLEFLQNSPLEEVAAWFQNNPGIGKFVDKITGSGEGLIPVSNHDDEFLEEEVGYGKDQSRPEDYINSFKDFIEKNQNDIVALKAVLTKPSDLTRAELRQLELKLDEEGFTETHLSKAFQHQSNAEIAAGIIGYIRRASLGDPLVSYSERVDNALDRIGKSQEWSEPQQRWLLRIAKQMKIEFVVDREVLNKDQFKDAGGFNRINQVFDGKLEAVIKSISENVWKKEA